MKTVELSDGISFVALLVAAASLICATRQSKLAERPVKLDAYRIIKEFLVFCSRYMTLYSFKQISGTRDLWCEIDAFAWNMEKLGPTEVPGLSCKYKEILQKAKLLQRELERLTTAMNRNENKEVIENLESSVNEIIDWFHEQHSELKSFFEPHI